MGSGVEGKTIFVLDSGGASRSICMVSVLNKAKKLYICNRTFEMAVTLSGDVNKQVPDSSTVVPMEYDKMKKVIEKSDIFINATGVGTFSEADKIPIDSRLLNKRVFVFDAIYNPPKTKDCYWKQKDQVAGRCQGWV